MAIKVNTGAIVNSAARISRYNNNISNDFVSVERAVMSLGSNWNSGVSSTAINSFQNIKKSYYEARYIVIDDMRKFMVNVAGEGYENAETSIASAASVFK